jgi:hypothetical protein
MACCRIRLAFGTLGRSDWRWRRYLKEIFGRVVLQYAAGIQDDDPVAVHDSVKPALESHEDYCRAGSDLTAEQIQLVHRSSPHQPDDHILYCSSSFLDREVSLTK